MPGRTMPIVTHEIYHIFNRGIDHRPTFTSTLEYRRGLEVAGYYRFLNLSLKLSRYLTLSQHRRTEMIQELEKSNDRLVDIFSFCFMPNHFHFLLKQERQNGIAKFMSNFQNSYTRYFNTKHKRIGPLFLDQFKAVRIETAEQFLHVVRYINLNPYTSYVVKTLDALKDYPWSSLSEFLKKQKGICDTSEITKRLKTSSVFQKFLFDQADYQRRLDGIKHLVFE